MTFTAFTNIITILFCLAVLVQSVRLARSLKQVRESQLDRTVGALDTATAKARCVLSELKETLSTEGAANALCVGEAKEVREELHVMVGIANAMAERLMEAASAGSRSDSKPAAVPAKAPKGTRPSRPRSAKTKQPKADASAPAKASPAKARPQKASAAADELLLETAAKKTQTRKPRNTAKLVADAKEAA
tara:strand:- start:616 stop:1188 length:573 start_codon:yes stop_codon:yes gene_type:complete